MKNVRNIPSSGSPREPSEAACERDIEVATRRGDEFAAYLRPFRKTRSLTSEEFLKLLHAYRASEGDQRKRVLGQLISGSMRMVVNQAWRWRNRGQSVQDLMQEGVIGLMKAIDRFEPKREIRFQTYAMYWVKQGMQHALQEYSDRDCYRISAQKHALLAEVRHAEQRLFQDLQRVPTDEEVLEHISRKSTRSAATVSKGHILWARMKKRSQEIRLDDLQSKGMEDRILHECISDPSVDIEVMVDAKRLIVRYARAMKSVLIYIDSRPSRSAYILRERLGLSGEVKTLNYLGDRLGIVAERIRQIEAKEYTRMQRYLRVDPEEVKSMLRIIEDLATLTTPSSSLSIS